MVGPHSSHSLRTLIDGRMEIKKTKGRQKDAIGPEDEEGLES